MSVENPNVIDIISIDQDGNALFTISDHLEWGENNEHLLILQDKVNYYLAAMESDDLYVQYPEARDKHFILRIIFLHHPNEDALFFLEKVREILAENGYGFQFKTGMD
jgi:hypothetical protein